MRIPSFTVPTSSARKMSIVRFGGPKLPKRPVFSIAYVALIQNMLLGCSATILANFLLEPKWSNRHFSNLKRPSDH